MEVAVFVGAFLVPGADFAVLTLNQIRMTLRIAAVSGIEDNEAGLASGLINTSQQVGGALGLAVLSSVATSHTADVTDIHDLTEGFQAAFLGCAAIAFIGFILTLVLISNRDSRAHVELGSAAAEST